MNKSVFVTFPILKKPEYINVNPVAQYLAYPNEAVMEAVSCTCPLCQPREKVYSDDEIIAAMEALVAEVGPTFSADSQSTRHPGPSGRRCIQGELMEALGAEDASHAGAWDGVAGVLGRAGDERMLRALANAQRRNDNHIPWGLILSWFKQDLGLAA